MSEFFSFLVDTPYRWILIVPDAFPFIWAGTIIGHSFIATPAKFKAKGLSLPVALEVGRATFTAFNRLEFIYLALITSVIIFAETHLYIWFIYAIVTASFLIQRFILRPVLFHRVEQIQANVKLPSSYHHTVYGVLELIKLLSLIGLGTLFITY